MLHIDDLRNAIRDDDDRQLLLYKTSIGTAYGLIGNLWNSENVRRVLELIILQMLSLTLTRPQHLAASSLSLLDMVVCAFGTQAALNQSV